MTHMYGSSGSEYVSCKGVPKGVEMEPKSINEEDRDLISSNINIENKMEVDTQQMSDDDWVLHSPASCLFESSGSEYVPGEEESSDDGDSVKLASIGVSSRENTEQGVGNLEAEENITNVSLEEASSTNNLQTLSVEATNTTEKINIFNASITTKGTKIIKTFPIKIKTSKLRVRNPDTWKRRKALLAREQGKAYTSSTGKIVPAKIASLENLCTEKCRLKCSSKFKDEERKSILNNFYALDAINGKNAL
ncbi:uncharacterized protein LOC126885115 isoform X2 [Diabrotica virgifera virgifera]|uniref:Uncharacterized protein n=1 Tax=Diabrotica virgifera virgifera TaxID=50390 RepID=A0ABM5KBD8_DIAVI|nr:uncharacterized protein LOC126885115 isoform X2 [Diabrotica virgifera virgifera]